MRPPGGGPGDNGMGINIGIMEMEAPSAPCKALRTEIVKAHVADPAGLEAGAIYDESVSYEDAKPLFEDWAAFVKRNRLNEEADAVYLAKVKKEDDLALLKPLAVSRYTGWVDMSRLDDAQRADATARADDSVTGWDLLDFDQMNAMCGSCPLSWDKGRGCIGAFGPDNSKLPEIASRHGCPIVASVPESAASDRRFTPEEAGELLREVAVLREALPAEGKVYVKRYSGPLDRMEAVARISQSEGCGFFFFRRRSSRRTRASTMPSTRERTPLIPSTSSSYPGECQDLMIGRGYAPTASILLRRRKSVSWL